MRKLQEYEKILLEEELMLNRLRVGGQITHQELSRLQHCVSELVKAMLGDIAMPSQSIFRNMDQAQGVWKSLVQKYPFLLKEEGWQNFLRENIPDVYAEWQKRRSAELMRARHGQQPRSWNPRR